MKLVVEMDFKHPASYRAGAEPLGCQCTIMANDNIERINEAHQSMALELACSKVKQAIGDLNKELIDM